MTLQNKSVTVVGGINLDILGISKEKPILRDSNIGRIGLSLGGVGRNIGDNISRLGLQVKLLSAIGNDIFGKKVLEDSKNTSLDLSNINILENKPTSVYLAVLDEERDMEIAINAMDIFEEITPAYIDSCKAILNQTGICIMDTNISQAVIEYITESYPDIPLFLDCVSTTKAMKAKNIVGKLHTIKPNRIEAEALTGIKIKSQQDLQNAGDWFLNQGTKQVYITLGSDGVFYKSKTECGHLKTGPVEIVNATGAGDAFVAGLAYCHFEQMNMRETARFSVAAAAVALSDEQTINPKMSVETIKMKMEELQYDESIFRY